MQSIHCISGFVNSKGIPCIQEVNSMKKTQSVTYRTDAHTKSVLLKICEEKKWSISQLSEEIIKEWLQEKYPQLMQEESEN